KAAALPRITDPADAVPDAADGGETDGSDADPDGVVADSALAIADGVSRLLDHGAPCVIVANVPDLALLPAVRAAAAEHGIDERIAEEAASTVTSSFNAELDARLAALE